MTISSLRQATEKARDPEVVARMLRKHRFERNGHGSAFDPDMPATASELADADFLIALSPGALPLIEALEKIISAPNVRTLRDAVFIAKTALTQIRRTLNHAEVKS